MHQSTLLLVEDQKDYRELLELLLRNEGFFVVEAEDGAQAIERLSQFAPDLILTDLMMPNVNGEELIRHVRTHPQYFSTPILAMTAGDEGLVTQAKLAGADEVLAKTVDFSSLIATLNRYTQSSSVGQANAKGNSL